MRVSSNFCVCFFIFKDDDDDGDDDDDDDDHDDDMMMMTSSCYWFVSIRIGNAIACKFTQSSCASNIPSNKLSMKSTITIYEIKNSDNK